VPIIGRLNDDPVENGMAKSLARPGGNISGAYSLAEELTPKRLSLLKEVVPSARRVGVLLRDDWPNARRAWQNAEEAAKQLGLELAALNASSAGDLATAFSDAGAKHLDGIITFRNSTVVTNLQLIVDQCRKLRLPAVFDACGCRWSHVLWAQHRGNLPATRALCGQAAQRNSGRRDPD